MAAANVKTFTLEDSKLDLGTVWRYTALLGAGLSRNWGGYLASEVWGALIGHPLVETNRELRQLLLYESNFESALAEVRSQPHRFSENHRRALESAIRDVFKWHDDNLLNRLEDDEAFKIWCDFSDSLLRPLVDAPVEHSAASFLFT
jgi:hypothetical protein